MSTIITIISGLLILTVLVIVHESGHFFVGKKCGMRIDEFAVGFGPKLLSRVGKDDIRYSVRALPLGGFVQFYGEDEEVDATYEPRAFNNRPIWQRAITLVAGPLMNILFALLVTILVLSIFGEYVPTVHTITKGMPAEEAGLLPGDQVVKINGKTIDFSMEYQSAIAGIGQSEQVEMTVLRNGEKIDFTVPLRYDETEGKMMMGVQFDTSTRKKFSVFEAIGLSFKWLYLIIVEMFGVLRALIFKGEGVANLAGPVGTISLIGQAVRSGPEVILRMAALLSVNLGIMNILPFPALDGGRLLFLGIEKLRGKPIPREKEGYINLAGLAVLFILMILLTYQDIARLLA